MGRADMKNGRTNPMQSGARKTGAWSSGEFQMASWSTTRKFRVSYPADEMRTRRLPEIGSMSQQRNSEL